MELNDDYKETCPLHQEAMFVADMHGIPRNIADDYYEAFVKFVREELDKRIKTGTVTCEIHPETLITVLMGEVYYNE